MPIFLQGFFRTNGPSPLVPNLGEDELSEDHRWETIVVSNGELGYTFIQQNWNKRNHIYDYFSIKMGEKKIESRWAIY